MYRDQTTAACDTCPKNTYSLGGVKDCTKCPRGNENTRRFGVTHDGTTSLVVQYKDFVSHEYLISFYLNYTLYSFAKPLFTFTSLICNNPLSQGTSSLAGSSSALQCIVDPDAVIEPTEGAY